MNEAHDHEHHHDDGAPEMSALGHQSRRLVVPYAVVAATFTVLHEQGLPFTVGAVATWLLLGITVTLAAAHDWTACSHCDKPPARWNTEAKRARIARRMHHRGWRILIRTTVLILVFHAVLPKPYLATWWAKIAAGVFYLLAALMLSWDAVSFARHSQQYTSECPMEWCRAGLKRNPKRTARHYRQMWAGHYAAWLIAVLAPPTCALGVVSMTHPALGLRIAYGVLLVLLVTVITDVAVHSDEPCLRCARHLPDNPEEAAERRMPWLRWFHHTRYVALSAAGFTIVASWVLSGTTPAKLLVCFTGLLIMYWTVLNRIHAPVKPWCPWCKDDDGDAAEAEVPDPSTNVPSPA